MIQDRIVVESQPVNADQCAAHDIAEKYPPNHRSRLTRGLLAFVVLVGLSSAPVLADFDPSVGRGIDPEKLYQFGSVDSVDLSTGALSIPSIPIGISYPVSSGFSYQLSLSYTARAWDYRTIGSGNPCTAAYPSRNTQAGMGWSLHLGLLLSPLDPTNPEYQWGNPDPNGPWYYVDPAGGQHRFFGTLHDGETFDVSAGYTRDSSYLRLRHLSGDVHEIEFPDGTIKKFEHQSARPSYEHRLTEIRDRFKDTQGNPTNWVRIAYDDTSLRWTITDKRGRSHTVQFVNKAYDTSSKPMVDYIDFQAFDGSPGHWDFKYFGEPSPGTTTIYRDYHDTCPNPTPQFPEGTTVQLSVALLESIVLPDGSTWAFQYHNDQPGGTPGIRQSEMSEVKLPTGGRIQYNYQGVTLAANDPCPDDGGFGEIYTVGISTRTFVDPIVVNPAMASGTWTYDYELTFEEEYPDPFCEGFQDAILPASELKTTVGSPRGDKTEYFFSVWSGRDESVAQFVREDWGLPFTKLEPDEGGRFLSSRHYDCDAGGGNCQLLRSEYVLYDSDGPSNGGTNEIRINRNRRVKAQRTVYHDDLDRYSDTESATFDGIGHFRQAVTSGNFITSTGQTTYTNWNSWRGTFPGSYTPLLLNEPWVLETYDYVEVTGGTPSDTARREFDFESYENVVPPAPVTGFLRSVRTLKAGTSTGDNDLLTVYCRDDMGNVTSEHSYGGDGALNQLPSPLPNCDTGVPPTDAQYRIDHTYASGALKSSKYNGTTFFTLDLDINAATGLASASRDTAGMQVNLFYDDQGRLTEVKPQAFGSVAAEAQTRFIYWTESNGLPAAVETRRCPPGASQCSAGSGGNSLTQEYVEFTGFGRPWHEVRKMPDVSDWAVRVTRYDTMGSKARISSWVYDADVTFADENALPATVFTGYDPFGRVGTVTTPDGKATTHAYEGVEWVMTDQDLALTIGAADQCVRRWDRYDLLGRLDRVEEAYTSCTAGGTPGMKTRYEYDEAGRLTKVCQNETGTTCNQVRLFSYDNRGFLATEQHPEKGASGHGTVSYSCYDARGHARYRDDGAATGRRVGYEYDAAERLIKAWKPPMAETCNLDPGNPAGWKVFTFATTNSAGQANLGKLKKAYRQNVFQGGTGFPVFAPVTEEYTYSGVGGRPSARKTSFNFHGSQVWNLTQTYDQLGNPATIGYPAFCKGGTCGTPDPWDRTVTMSYEQGLLESISDDQSISWLTDMSYHPSGMVNEVVHGNGMKETIAIAGNGMSRPHSIQVRNSANQLLWETGTYAYDGGGNIKTLTATAGTDQFRYDKFSRLREARLNTVSAPIQTYTFDAYGNLTQIQTGTTINNFPVEGTTNRLSSMAASYDASGNLLTWSDNTYTYDLFNTTVSRQNSSEGWFYAYTADDERVAGERIGFDEFFLTLRGFGNQVLRRFTSEPTFADTVITQTDYIYRPGGILGAYTFIDDGSKAPTRNSPEWWPTAGERHFALDHLGTTRLITSASGTVLATHTYYPFGREASLSGELEEVMRFAGHERDLNGTPQGDDDQDYMHARYSNPLMARFLTVDPIAGDPATPQGWNRYAYVLGNPLRLIDPDGKAAIIYISGSDKKAVSDKHGKHTLYGATIVRFSVEAVNGIPTLRVKSTTKVYVGLTAEGPSISSRNATLRSTGDPRAVRFGDVPAGTFEVTKSNGAKGAARGWFMFNGAGESRGVVTVGGVKRDGMSIHPGLPCNSTGCITTPDWSTFRQQILPELDSGEPVVIAVPDLYGGTSGAP